MTINTSEQYRERRFTLHHGDSREILKGFAEASVDAIVCDPPYELGFMGKSWDNSGIAYDPVLWGQALRVLKPGGHLLAFGGTRTFHRLACAIEDAGFELRDAPLRGHTPLQEDCPWLGGWMYGSGFPKSHNGEWGGTALKPAWEPIVMARKPLIGTVDANWRAHGTGALNIDGCRIEYAGTEDAAAAAAAANFADGMRSGRIGAGSSFPTVYDKPDFDPIVNGGRWPANLIHDGSPEVLACFPDAPGQMADVKYDAEERKTGNVYGAMKRGHEPSADSDNEGAVGFKMKPGARRLDEGSAARFFYCAKATQEDRNEGCSGLPERIGGMVSNTSGQHITRRDGGAPGPRANHHPTVKPTDLMRYLCRLVTPKGGLILDPFMGSGSTGKAAMLEGFNFVGIDLTAEYVEIARARIDFALRQGHQPSLLEAA